MSWALRFLGVGNASAVELGSPMAVIERNGQPWLTIDCGGEGLTAYHAHYGAMPDALFVTHVHLDHDNCLETALLRGATARVRRFGEAVITERGVRHGQINIVPVSMETSHAHGETAHLHGQDVRHVHVKPKT